MDDGIPNGGETDNNNAAPPPLAGGEESQFMQDLRRDLPSKLYRLGFVTSATAVGGLVEHLVAAARSRARLAVFLLVFTLFGALGTIYAARRLEVEVELVPAATRRWRRAGVPIYFFCLLLLSAAVSLVGSDYCELALNLLDN